MSYTIQRANRLLQIASKSVDPSQVLAEAAATSETPFKLAGVLLARLSLTGGLDDVPATPMYQEAKRIAEASLASWKEVSRSGCGSGPNACGQTEKGLTTNYEDIIPPSDQTRADRKVWNEKRGIVYVGDRYVKAKPRQRVGRFHSEYAYEKF